MIQIYIYTHSFSYFLFHYGLRQDIKYSSLCYTIGSYWGREDGGGKDWEFGISRCKLLYIGCINNKVLLYGTGNYIQYPVINHNGKECEKEHMYN